MGSGIQGPWVPVNLYFTGCTLDGGNGDGDGFGSPGWWWWWGCFKYSQRQEGWPHPALPGRAAWVPTTIGMAPRSSAKAARCACAHIQTHECINSGNGDWQRAKSQIAQGNRLQIRSGNRMAGAWAWAWPWGSHTSTQAHAWVCTMAGQGIAYRAAHTGQRHGNGDVGQGRAACAHGQGLQGALWRIHELRFL
jgi:hypothetical protein